MYTYHTGHTRYIYNRSQFERAGFLFDIVFFIAYNKGILKEKNYEQRNQRTIKQSKNKLSKWVMGSIIGGVVFHDTESMILGVLSLILLELFNLNDKLDNKNSK